MSAESNMGAKDIQCSQFALPTVCSISGSVETVIMSRSVGRKLAGERLDPGCYQVAMATGRLSAMR